MFLWGLWLLLSPWKLQYQYCYCSVIASIYELSTLLKPTFLFTICSVIPFRRKNKNTFFIEYSNYKQLFLDFILTWPLWKLNRQTSCLSPRLSVLQVTGEEYVQRWPPCVTAAPPPWTQVWSQFRTMDSSCHLDMSSWPSPMNSVTAWGLRSVASQGLQKYWQHLSDTKWMNQAFMISENMQMILNQIFKMQRWQLS